jgi:hypothetical protein
MQITHNQKYGAQENEAVLLWEEWFMLEQMQVKDFIFELS